MTEGRTLLSLMEQGGAVMWPLFALLVVTIGVTVERSFTFIYLSLRKKRWPKERLEKPLTLLDFIAMIAPVLGFLGTVTGMIQAFKSLSEAMTVELQVVAGGLYEALFTTAFGLIISVGATVCSFILERSAEALCEKNTAL